MDPFCTPHPLDTREPCDARYSDALRAEVTDAIIQTDGGWTVDTDEFLAALWRRGFKVVPNGDGRWIGDDNDGSH